MSMWPAFEASFSAAPVELPQKLPLTADCVELPVPTMTGGLTLMDALAQRRSTRNFSDRPLPLATVSNLLWAAYGINRSDGGRTAAYWRHILTIEILVAMADGVWAYDPSIPCLRPHLREDIRRETGLQDFVGIAPIELIYLAHGECTPDLSQEDCRLFCSVDTGFIGQNVYLFCASVGLATVFRGAIPYEKLQARLNLHPRQFVTFAQTVGYPKN